MFNVKNKTEAFQTARYEFSFWSSDEYGSKISVAYKATTIEVLAKFHGLNITAGKTI